MNLDNLVVSCYSLFQKRMLNGHERLLTDVVLNTFNDDRTYLYLCHLNGYVLKPCTKWCYTTGDGRGVSRLPAAPRSDYQYKSGAQYDSAVAQVVADLCDGRSIGECFGWFRKHCQEGNTKAD